MAGRPLPDEPDFLGDFYTTNEQAKAIELLSTECEVWIARVDASFMQFVTLEYKLRTVPDCPFEKLKLSVVGSNVEIRLSGFAGIPIQHQEVSVSSLPVEIQSSLSNFTRFYENDYAELPLNTFEIPRLTSEATLTIRYSRPAEEFVEAENGAGSIWELAEFRFWLNKSLTPSPFKLKFTYPGELTGPEQNLKTETLFIAPATAYARAIPKKTATDTIERVQKDILSVSASRQVEIPATPAPRSATYQEILRGKIMGIVVSCFLLAFLGGIWWYYRKRLIPNKTLIQLPPHN